MTNSTTDTATTVATITVTTVIANFDEYTDRRIDDSFTTHTHTVPAVDGHTFEVDYWEADGGDFTMGFMVVTVTINNVDGNWVATPRCGFDTQRPFYSFECTCVHEWITCTVDHS